MLAAGSVRGGAVPQQGRQDWRLVRFLVRHALVGIAVGWNLLGLLLVLDVAGLGTLVAQSAHRWEALALLLAGFAVTFGGVAMATAIFLIPFEEPPCRPEPPPEA